MNARNYDLNPAAAKEANSGGKRISEHGIYSGVVTAAWYEKNDKGTESVNFIFTSEAGQEAGPLSLYTHNGDGKELPSYKMLNAIMACMKIRKIAAVNGSVKLYDFDSQKEVTKQKDIYPEFIGHRLGLVLTTEEYRKNNGDHKTRLVIAAPFEAETHRMADEVLNKSESPIALDKFTDYLTDKKRWFKALPQQAQERPYDGHAAPEFNDDLDF